jgi:hypothetical protein
MTTPDIDELLCRSAEPLVDFVRHDLLERGSELKRAALRQATEICLTDLGDAVKRYASLLALDEQRRLELLERSRSEDEWAHQRIKRAQARVELFVRSALKERCLRDVEGFAETLRGHIISEVEANDLDLVRPHLDGYIGAL